MLDPGIVTLHVKQVGVDLIYATSYDKPKEYVDEILAEVGRLVMREVSTRASEGTPRYALDIARQRSHSAKHPLMVHGYLSASKVDQSSLRQTYRSQSARAHPCSTATGQRLLYHRPENRRRSAPQQLQQLTRVTAWDSGPGSATTAHPGAGAETSAVGGKPNKTILLRTRSTESSVWDVRLERLAESQCASSSRHRQRAKDSELKLKLMNRDFAKSAESLHGFLVGAQYNRSRGITDVANGLGESRPEKSEFVPARLTVDTGTSAAAAAATDSSYAASQENFKKHSVRQSGGTVNCDVTKVRPVSAVAAANDQAPWTQLYASNPPLYSRPYSSIAGGRQQPVTERPLSALHKAIVVTQLPSASTGFGQPLQAKAGTSTATRVAPAAILKGSRSGIGQQRSIDTLLPKTTTVVDALRIVSHRIVQHAHTAHAPSMVHGHQITNVRTTDVASALPKARQAKRDALTSTDRSSGGQQLGNASDMSVDGLGLGLRDADLERSRESASSVDSRGPNLDSPHVDQAQHMSQSSAVEQQDRDIPVAVPQTTEEVDTEGSPVVAAGGASETPASSRLSIHVDVAVLHEEHEYSHASDNGDYC